MIKVGLIGAGRRIKNNFLPALALRKDQFSVEWIHARTEESTKTVASAWNTEPAFDLTSQKLASVDLVAISVPIDQNIIVLKKLQEAAPNLSVLIDTPIATSFKTAREAYRLLGRFRQARAAEDYMNYPEFEISRRIIDKGWLGNVHKLNFFGLGFMYHGQALLRSYNNFDSICSARHQSLGGPFDMTTYFLGNGMSATITGPYRRDYGSLGFVGDKGILTSYREGEIYNQHRLDKKVFGLEFVKQDSVIKEVLVSGPDATEILPLPEIAEFNNMDIEDKSDINLKRSWGLGRIFDSFLTESEYNINTEYTIGHALEDSLYGKISKRLSITVNRLPIGKKGIVRSLID